MHWGQKPRDEGRREEHQEEGKYDEEEQEEEQDQEQEQEQEEEQEEEHEQEQEQQEERVEHHNEEGKGHDEAAAHGGAGCRIAVGSRWAPSDWKISKTGPAGDGTDQPASTAPCRAQAVTAIEQQSAVSWGWVGEEQGSRGVEEQTSAMSHRARGGSSGVGLSHSAGEPEQGRSSRRRHPPPRTSSQSPPPPAAPPSCEHTLHNRIAVGHACFFHYPQTAVCPIALLCATWSCTVE